jgi:hypothetical protein
MWTHFRHLIFKKFSMLKRTLQSNEFWPLKFPFEDLGVHPDSNSQNGNLFGNMGVHSLTFSYIFRNMKCDSWVSLLVHTFANPCFDHEHKARVVTIFHLWFIIFLRLPFSSVYSKFEFHLHYGCIHSKRSQKC